MKTNVVKIKIRYHLAYFYPTQQQHSNYNASWRLLTFTYNLISTRARKCKPWRNLLYTEFLSDETISCQLDVLCVAVKSDQSSELLLSSLQQTHHALHEIVQKHHLWDLTKTALNTTFLWCKKSGMKFQGTLGLYM